ncbi:HlyD family efflux transporter periplasmic adaptor subunit [Ruegeria pomeroyi]|uniref:HlyD family efflux transporter periplasmic adaptor subunit n=2 Tax=Ruegeria pomeroyi TaxID=89184 RepID=A0A9Q3WLH1_9RHOB|nr:HlyD family efflux transporter periplasmic adaptor subunit [Ruegeria pomeroyi]MCE8538098.1 HlyD family efflux transporter periplasmic adaptor subunit [Ruegeria pomeroyi]MCE8556436.1 HlyD family efflux transporter periplasmic adaptor subunit [Ruegeria pomeroyi]
MDSRSNLETTAGSTERADESAQMSPARDDEQAFLAAWSDQLCKRLSADLVVIALGPRDTGPFRLAARAPEDAEPGEGLASAVDLTIAQRKPIVKSGFQERGVTCCAVGVPVLRDGALYGVIAVQLVVRADLDLRRVVDEVKWALPAVQLRLMVCDLNEGALSQARARAAVELLAGALDEPRWPVAAATAVTDFCDRLACDRVALGRRHRRRSKVVSLSHSGNFQRSSELVQRIADAMDEAIDQGGPIRMPQDGENTLTLTAAHQELIHSGVPRAVLTVLLRRDGRVTGAMVLERGGNNPFRDEEVDLVEAVAGILGPVLEEKRLNDRSLPVKVAAEAGRFGAAVLGPRKAGLKATLLLVCVALWFAWTTAAPFHITADARVEGEIRRVVASPLDGYVSSAAAIPGDIVAEGDILATLDHRDLQLEIARWTTVRAQRQREYETALAERDRAAIGIAATQIGQAEAEIALLEERLARTQLRAPFDGVVLSGDLDQSVGAPVSRGQVLYEIAPLDAYRIVLSVDERDLALVGEGLAGEVILTALPGQTFGMETGRVTSVAGVEDGRNVFRVDAQLSEQTDLLRPGMEGIAKITVDERPLLMIWTHGLRNWARMAVWRWLP